jgi:hypothetical protein
MTSELDPDMRWLVERIDRNHQETTADIARLEAQFVTTSAILDRYVLAQVYDARETARDAREEARDARIKRIEGDVTAKARGVRAAWLAAVGAVASAVGIEVINAVTRGTGH